MSNIFQIVYISSADQEFLQDAAGNIDDIIEVAITENSERNVTGILIYRGGIFLQLLEGNKEDVYFTLGRITTDPRHGRIKTLLKQDSDQRLFSTWSMALRKLTDDEMPAIEEILPWKELEDARDRQIRIPNDKINRLIKYFAYKK